MVKERLSSCSSMANAVRRSRAPAALWALPALLLAIPAPLVAVVTDPKPIITLAGRGIALVNGTQAELNARFRGYPADRKLQGELQAGLAPGTLISFCLNSQGAATLVATAPVALVFGIPTASFELDTVLGDAVPNVAAGDAIEAHQGAADCTAATLLVSARFG